MSCVEKLQIEESTGEVINTDTSLNDPYAYTMRNEFTSEKIKLEIGGFVKGCSVGQVKKLLYGLGVKPHKVKGSGRNCPLFVTFKEEEERDKALGVINGHQYRGSSLYAKIADPAKDPLISRNDSARVKAPLPSAPVKERVAKAVTPYHEMLYKEQLKIKQRAALAVLKKYGNQLNHLNPELSNWIYFHKMRRNGQVCEVDPIVPSPVKEGYRNKCEFTIGTNSEMRTSIVGFRVSSYKEGSIEVAPVDDLRNVSPAMKKVCKVFEEYLVSSPYQSYDPITHAGVWRQLTVRTSNNEDILVIVVLHPQDFNEATLTSLKREVCHFEGVSSFLSGQFLLICFQTLRTMSLLYSLKDLTMLNGRELWKEPADSEPSIKRRKTDEST